MTLAVEVTPANHQHLMTPTSVAVLLLMALTLDYLTVGPPWLRDRVAFVFALVAIREGFDGSPLDAWTVAQASAGISWLLAQTGGAYIAGASVNVVLGAMVGCLAIYVIGQMLPAKLVNRLGRFAALKFKPSPINKLNAQLWITAVLIGMMLDLPRGQIGAVLLWLYSLALQLVGPLPALLFGGA